MIHRPSADVRLPLGDCLLFIPRGVGLSFVGELSFAWDCEPLADVGCVDGFFGGFFLSAGLSGIRCDLSPSRAVIISPSSGMSSSIMVTSSSPVIILVVSLGGAV